MTGRWLAVTLVACGGSSDVTPDAVDSSVDDVVAESALDSAVLDIDDTAAPPDAAATITPIADQVIEEDKLLEIPVVATAPVEVTGLPPGAHFDRAASRIRFRPDFIQGGEPAWTVSLRAGTATASFKITVVDTIKPPPLVVTKTEEVGGCRRITLTQKTDDYTDSKGYAGRTFAVVASIPKTASVDAPVAVSMRLHGVGGVPSATLGCGSQILVEPHDPMTSYWWGYSTNLPAGSVTTGTVPPYTARRVLQLVEWSRTQGGDPRRVFITGGSMGGAGAMTIGLLWARHFAGIDASLGQAIPRNHRPSRLATLEKLWGTRALNLDDGAGMGVWDRQDLTRVLRDEPEAAGQFVFVKHGKDDPTIHFGAMTIASPLTKLTFYQALHGHPHYAVWDEGAHGPADPVMPAGWWDGGWSRATDSTAFLRLDRIVPAFENASHDGNPGDGTGNGKVAWSPESGFAGKLEVAGDTGWKGDLAGAINRHLRWDASKGVDANDRIELPLRVFSGIGMDPPRAGYPTIDDRVAATLPIRVDVTVRRAQSFVPLPGQKLAWEFGAQKGEIIVSTDGSFKIPGLLLSTEWATLKVTR
jgi:hypothetical protein